MIEINELNEIALDEIKALLKETGSNSFEIAFPKSTQLSFSASEDIARDYLLGAFVGQELSELGSDFAYTNVSVSKHESFEYTVVCNDLDLLANKLLFFTYYFDNGTEADYEDFMEAISDFEGKLDVIRIACPDMIEDYKEYLAEAGNSDDEEE